MKATDLITVLAKGLAEHGDLDVVFPARIDQFASVEGITDAALFLRSGTPRPESRRYDRNPAIGQPVMDHQHVLVLTEYGEAPEIEAGG